ncbi:hypothetical protein BG004_006546 [Podila humilis]|nr:hypothetical protein BG004_006546 [Podila humilis]
MTLGVTNGDVVVVAVEEEDMVVVGEDVVSGVKDTGSLLKRWFVDVVGTNGASDVGYADREISAERRLRFPCWLLRSSLLDVCG